MWNYLWVYVDLIVAVVVFVVWVVAHHLIVVD